MRILSALCLSSLCLSALCLSALCLLSLSATAGLTQSAGALPASSSPPPLRWAHRPEGDRWSAATLAALDGPPGARLAGVVPRDIAEWCPAYPEASLRDRQAFWAGLVSGIALQESGLRPRAVGGGGKWFGLMQIAPATARGHGCSAQSGAALKDGPDNLSCAVRIMAAAVARDRAVGLRDSRWRGVAADWGVLRSEAKRRDIAGWTRRQPYCIALRATRPRPRPF